MGDILTSDTDLELNALEQFHGTQEYHSLEPLLPGAVVTDGVEYIMDNGYSWVVTDACAIILLERKLKGQAFVVVELKLLDNSEADIIYTDGNDNELYRQHYDYTNAKKGFKLYFTDHVMMLPGEY